MYKEEKLSKAYDSKIMRRLLAYAKPYWLSLSICIILIALIAITNLAQPYIIKLAIDNYIIEPSSVNVLNFKDYSISGLTALSIFFLFPSLK